MSKKLKVFGGTVFYGKSGEPRKQVRVIVATFTKKQAVELLNSVNDIAYGISYNDFNDYFCETGNDIELSVATEVGLYVSEKIFNSKVENYTKIA